MNRFLKRQDQGRDFLPPPASLPGALARPPKLERATFFAIARAPCGRVLPVRATCGRLRITRAGRLSIDLRRHEPGSHATQDFAETLETSVRWRVRHATEHEASDDRAFGEVTPQRGEVTRERGK